MDTAGIFFGSTTGNTAQVAEQLRDALGTDGVALHDIGKARPEDLGGYTKLILGTSTWGLGELEDGWRRFLPKLEGMDLAGKTIALFGLGDQKAFPDTFVDGLGVLHGVVTARGAHVVGPWPVDGYVFNTSKAVVNGQFVGLVIDQDRQADQTADRITAWAAQLRKAFGVGRG